MNIKINEIKANKKNIDEYTHFLVPVFIFNILKAHKSIVINIQTFMILYLEKPVTYAKLY
jgi:hypothetical protein